MKFLALLLIPSLAFANTYAEWGVAFDHPGATKYSEVKYAEFGVSGEQGKMAYKIGGGGWIDKTGYEAENEYGLNVKAQNSVFIHALIGVEPKTDHIYMGYKLGPAIIYQPDSLLGSNLQISHEFSLGMRDYRDVRVGLVVKHFSNAGLLSKINEGRNFVGMEIQF